MPLGLGYPPSMPTPRKESDYLNGVPELLMLRLLARKPMHGYELVQAIRFATGGVVAFGEGCVYPILHRLEEDGVLAGGRESVGGRSRVVYRITAAGRKRLQASASRWETVAAAIAGVLGGDGHAAPGLA